MTFSYIISRVNENERWLFISSNGDDINETDSFVFLLKSIASQTSGKIREIGNFQHTVEDASLPLIYQWDSLFGITVKYPESVSVKQVRTFFETLPWFE